MKLNEKVMDFLKNNKVWNIATYGEDGAHVVPCFHTAVLDGETLVVSAVFLRTTLKNIAENGSVAVSVFAPTPTGMFEGYHVMGKATYTEEGEAYEVGKALVGQKPLPYRGALVIKVENGTVTSPGPNVGKSFDNVQW